MQTGRKLASERPGRSSLTRLVHQDSAQSFVVWRHSGPLFCGRRGPGPGAWMQSQADLMKTRLGLASEGTILEVWECAKGRENVLKAVEEKLTSNDVGGGSAWLSPWLAHHSEWFWSMKDHTRLQTRRNAEFEKAVKWPVSFVWGVMVHWGKISSVLWQVWMSLDSVYKTGKGRRVHRWIESEDPHMALIFPKKIALLIAKL